MWRSRRAGATMPRWCCSPETPSSSCARCPTPARSSSSRRRPTISIRCTSAGASQPRRLARGAGAGHRRVRAAAASGRQPVLAGGEPRHARRDRAARPGAVAALPRARRTSSAQPHRLTLRARARAVADGVGRSRRRSVHGRGDDGVSGGSARAACGWGGDDDGTSRWRGSASSARRRGCWRCGRGIARCTCRIRGRVWRGGGEREACCPYGVVSQFERPSVRRGVGARHEADSPALQAQRDPCATCTSDVDCTDTRTAETLGLRLANTCK